MPYLRQIPPNAMNNSPAEIRQLFQVRSQKPSTPESSPQLATCKCSATPGPWPLLQSNANSGRTISMQVCNVSNQKRPQRLGFPLSSSTFPAIALLDLLLFGFAGNSEVGGRAGPPDAAARIAAIRCFARSSPSSAALTYQTLASRGSRRQPIPISVK